MYGGRPNMNTGFSNSQPDGQYSQYSPNNPRFPMSSGKPGHMGSGQPYNQQVQAVVCCGGYMWSFECYFEAFRNLWSNAGVYLSFCTVSSRGIDFHKMFTRAFGAPSLHLYFYFSIIHLRRKILGRPLILS